MLRYGQSGKRSVKTSTGDISVDAMGDWDFEGNGSDGRRGKRGHCESMPGNAASRENHLRLRRYPKEDISCTTRDGWAAWATEGELWLGLGLQGHRVQQTAVSNKKGRSGRDVWVHGALGLGWHWTTMDDGLCRHNKGQRGSSQAGLLQLGVVVEFSKQL
jgi:hypothetical protein